MPVYPFTYEHREHAISDNDCNEHWLADNDHPVKFDRHHLDHLRNYYTVVKHDQPVTVSDLLDAERDDHDHYRDLYRRADNATRVSFNNLRSALASHERHQEFIARLSPEERAEYDRRTT